MVTPNRVAMLQEANTILIKELWKHRHYRKIRRAFFVLLLVKSVGDMGDGRMYKDVACVQCVQTSHYMTADFYHLPHGVIRILSERVINEVRGVSRLCYDIY
mmetsp:Transcript_28898/g.66137  ORF Transcript_28898/g.66137 Transcript_28898/m.66137 type:complete len:102 (-) Transcript_28898:341-646(-)